MKRCQADLHDRHCVKRKKSDFDYIKRRDFVFLNDPNFIIAGCRFADKDDFRTKRKWLLLIFSTNVTQKYELKKYRWFRAASLRRWTICIVLCLITLITADILLNIGLRHNEFHSTSFLYCWNLEFEVVFAELLITSLNYFEFAIDSLNLILW